VSEDWPISTHADPTFTRRAIFHERHISSVTFKSANLYGNVYIRVGMARALAVFYRFRASEGAKFTKICDSLPWTPINRRAKFDAASFILGGEIRNRTNKHKITQTNSKRYMYTSCLSVCADKNLAYCKVMNGTILRCTRSTVDTVKCPCRREITQYFCNDDDDGDDNACNVLELFSGSSDDTIYLLAIIGGSVAATVVIATLIGIIAWRVKSTSRSSVAAAAQTSPVSSTPQADKWAVHTRVDPSRRDDTGRHNNGYHSDDCDMFYTSHTWSFNIVVCFVGAPCIWVHLRYISWDWLAMLWCRWVFILYTTPLSTLISSLSFNHHLYADDTQLLFSFYPPVLDSTITHLQHALQHISYGWPLIC